MYMASPKYYSLVFGAELIASLASSYKQTAAHLCCGLASCTLDRDTLMNVNYEIFIDLFNFKNIRPHSGLYNIYFIC